MPPYFQETLKLFFDIPQAKIDFDLSRVHANFDSFFQDEKDFLALSAAEKTPLRRAASYHNRLVRAHIFRGDPLVADDIALQVATLPAMQVAEDAAISSLARGSLGTFVAEMDRIEERDKPCPGEGWETGRAPVEYEKARSAFNETITKIQDTVFTHVLRRYRFDDIADLHEADRMVYDVRVEAGRRLLQTRAGEYAKFDAVMVGQIMRRYGVPGYRLLQNRLKNGGR